MIKKIVLAVIALMITSRVESAPAILTGGTIAGVERWVIRANLFVDEITTIHSDSGEKSGLANGESRRFVRMPINIAYGVHGLPSVDELSVSFSYFDMAHTLANGQKLSKTGIGDISFMARRIWNDIEHSRVLFGIGVTIPTGKSIFDIGSSELPTGDGFWELLASLSNRDVRGSIILYGDITYHLRLPIRITSVRGTAVNEAKTNYAHRITWGVGIEYPVSSRFSMLAEVTGDISYERSASYSANGANAASDINALGSPEFPLQQTNRIFVAPQLQIALIEKMRVSAGLQFPILVSNGYSGVHYTASLYYLF